MSATSRTRLVQVGIVGGGAVLGMLTMISAYRIEDWTAWAPDLAVGVAFVVLSARAARQSTSTAVLAAAVALAWWLGTLAPDVALYWHRGPLVHLLLAAPLGRLRPRWLVWPVAAGYAASAFPAVWGQPAVAIVLAAAWAVVAPLAMRARGGRSPGDRLALVSSLVLAATILCGAAASLVVAHNLATRPALLLYESVLIAVSLLLMQALRARDPRRVADVVLELGDRVSGDLSRALASALGDPTLVVGYWDAVSQTFRTASGDPVDQPSVSSLPRRTTRIDRAGEPFVLLLHDVALDTDGDLLRAVRAATLLTATNADLRARTQAAITDVRRSDRRLAAAERDERAELGTLLADSVLSDLRKLDAEWDAADDDYREALGRARSLLMHAATALERAVAGLRTGPSDRQLGDAIGSLADRLGLTATLLIDQPAVPAEVEHALYEAAAEALTNVAKHARGAAVEVSLVRADRLVRLVVMDDGPGGARPDAGTGLRGVAARVDALGGKMMVDSAPGGGARIIVTIPVRRS